MSKNDAYAPLVRASVAACIGAAVMLGSFPVSQAAEAEDEEPRKRRGTGGGAGHRHPHPGARTYTSANPMTTITGEEMRQLGIVNVADALLQLVPQNISTYTPGLIGDDQAGTGGGGHGVPSTAARSSSATPSPTCAAWIRPSARAR